MLLQVTSFPSCSLFHQHSLFCSRRWSLLAVSSSPAPSGLVAAHPPLARMGHRSGSRGLAAARVMPCKFPFRQPTGLHETVELCLEQGECSSRGWDSQTELVLPLASIKGAVSRSGECPSLSSSVPGVINLPWRYGAAQVTKRNGLCNCREQGQKKISIADTKMILKMLKLSK